MPRAPIRKIQLLRFIAPTFAALIVLLINIDRLHLYDHLHWALIAAAAMLAVVALLGLVYLLLRLDFALLFLAVDGLSLYISTLLLFPLSWMFTGTFGNPPPPMNVYTIGVVCLLLIVILAALPTLYLTAIDLHRVWIATRTYFGYPPNAKPAPEKDPAEFPVSPGWDTCNPPPPLPATAPVTPPAPTPPPDSPHP